VVLERGQLVDVLGGQQVRAGGEDLPQLDERGPQVVQEEPEAPGRGGSLGLGRDLDGLPAADQAPDACSVEQLTEAVLAGDDADLPQPVEILEGFLDQGARNLAPGANPP
jgi:hypothetical protein